MVAWGWWAVALAGLYAARRVTKPTDASTTPAPENPSMVTDGNGTRLPARPWQDLAMTTGPRSIAPFWADDTGPAGAFRLTQPAVSTVSQGGGGFGGGGQGAGGGGGGAGGGRGQLR